MNNQWKINQLTEYGNETFKHKVWITCTTMTVFQIVKADALFGIIIAESHKINEA